MNEPTPCAAQAPKGMLKIVGVKEGSPAQQRGLRRNDVLVSVGANPVRDIIDFMYYAEGEVVRATARRDSRIFEVELRRDEGGVFGLRFEPLKPLTCSNRCVFCFVDQLPQGLRESLYVKDEDYRLSFLYGNFITMTNLGPARLKRIVEQRLSPLYVSVHATNASLRSRMLGVSRGTDVLAKLQVLKDGGIHIHAQVVLCPGMNDGAELEKTVRDLAQLFPSVRSVAVVPVGLTRFRRGLAPLKPVDERSCERLLECVDRWQRVFVQRMGTRFVFAADEFYVLAGSEVPGAEDYEGYPQLENGVGMVRSFLERVRSLEERLRRLTSGRRLAILTGKLIEQVCTRALGNESTRVIGVRNHFFGESVTVTGLLTGADILNALRNLRPGEVGLVVGSCLNEDGLFLDGMHRDELEKLSGHSVLVEGICDGTLSCDNSGSPKRGEVYAFQ